MDMMTIVIMRCRQFVQKARVQIGQDSRNVDTAVDNVKSLGTLLLMMNAMTHIFVSKKSKKGSRDQ